MIDTLEGRSRVTSCGSPHDCSDRIGQVLAMTLCLRWDAFPQGDHRVDPVAESILPFPPVST